MKKKFPKIIWILWLQGFENAPVVVKRCKETWEKANREWKLIELSEEKARSYIDIEGVIEKNRENIEKSDLSDIIRIKLLSKYGGVWVDSTCICQKPLDTWIHEYMESGFFAFSEPTVDRKIASWFLASQKDNYLTDSFRKNYVTYFLENEFGWQNTYIGNFLKMKIEGALNVNKKMPMFWFTYPVKKLLGMYSYFTFHYKFAETCYKDEKAQSIWDETPYYSANGPLKAIRNGLLSPPTENLKKEVLNRKEPMYKLSWKLSMENVNSKSTIAHVFENNPYLNSQKIGTNKGT